MYTRDFSAPGSPVLNYYITEKRKKKNTIKGGARKRPTQWGAQKRPAHQIDTQAGHRTSLQKNITNGTTTARPVSRGCLLTKTTAKTEPPPIVSN